MVTLKLMIQSALSQAGYALNEEMSNLDGVIEYLEMCNEHNDSANVYTPEDWVEDTRRNCPEYLVKVDYDYD